MQMKIDYDELTGLLPQKGKMRLIDEITECDTENFLVESRTLIRDSCIFFDKESGGLPNYVLFEFAAQSVAALMAKKAEESGEKGKIGFVLSVSNMTFDSDSVKSGSEVAVKAALESQMDNVLSFQAEFFADDKKIGSGKLTLMESEK